LGKSNWETPGRDAQAAIAAHGEPGLENHERAPQGIASSESVIQQRYSQTGIALIGFNLAMR
jgi:hypothetical protein